MQWSLFLLILTGQCVFFTCQLYKYRFVKKKLTWQEAQSYCRENHTDLATVYDMTDMERLRSSAKNRTKQAWIGLYSELNGAHNWMWRWSLPGVEFNENQSKWAPGEPNQHKPEYCVRMKNYQWQDVHCSCSHKFICYDAKNSSNKFHLIEDRKNWPEAQWYCRKHHTDLVSGPNQLEDKELISKISNRSDTAWTIGLFRDTWRWSDGSRFSFRNWNHTFFNYRPESKFCVKTSLDENLKWKKVDCTKKKSFFCYDDKMILIKESKSWDEALDYCRENHRDLVSITNLHEQRWVQEKAKKASTPFIWLGLRYTCTLDFWFWVSDKVVSYKNWASDGESDDCDMSGAMERGGEYKWYKKNDADKFNFICTKKGVKKKSE